MSTEPTAEPIVETDEKPSRLKKIGANLAVAGIYVIPVAIMGGSMYYGWKVTSMSLETAKLNLAIATANATEAAA